MIYLRYSFALKCAAGSWGSKLTTEKKVWVRGCHMWGLFEVLLEFRLSSAKFQGAKLCSWRHERVLETRNISLSKFHFQNLAIIFFLELFTKLLQNIILWLNLFRQSILQTSFKISNLYTTVFFSYLFFERLKVPLDLLRVLVNQWRHSYFAELPKTAKIICFLESQEFIFNPDAVGRDLF